MIDIKLNISSCLRKNIKIFGFYLNNRLIWIVIPGFYDIMHNMSQFLDVEHCNHHYYIFREVGNVVQKHASSQGYSVVRSYCGHGIHKLFHCAPNVPHYAKNKVISNI